jgi:hypothetical protein
MTYIIKNWCRQYETAETRKLKRLNWIAVPTDTSDKIYRRITRLENGAEVLGIWLSILEVASKMPERGVLKDKDGDLNFQDFEDIGGFPAEKYQMAVEILASDKIGWIEKEKCLNFKENGNLPTSPDDLPTSPDNLPKPPVYITLHNITLQDKTGHNTTGQDITIFCDSTFSAFRKFYPGTKRGDQIEFQNFKKHKDWKNCINLLLPSLENEIAHKSKLKELGKFCPEWKNLSTWINQRCWESEFSIIETSKPQIKNGVQSFGDRVFDDLQEGYKELGGIL